MGKGVITLNALEKYASKRKLTIKLAEIAKRILAKPTVSSSVGATLSGIGKAYSKSPIKVTASHTSNPMTSLSKMERPTKGIRGIMARGQGATDNLQRFLITRSLARSGAPVGMTWRDVMPKKSMTNLGVKAGPLSVGTTLSGGRPSTLNMGWGGKLSKNIRGNIGARLPVGADRNQRKPYFTGNIQGTF